jgi:uncharacterized protein (TIGR02246 family)
MSDSFDSPATTLYHEFLAAWNRRDATAIAALFTPKATVVGFDGSQMFGRQSIESELGAIFANHVTATYVGKVKTLVQLGPNAAMVTAIAGMVPPGQAELNPAVNTIQSVVVEERDGHWAIAHLQSTPAAFHGRPELSEALTSELRALL